MLSKIVLVACLLSFGEASNPFLKKVKKLTETKGRDLNDDECMVYAFQFLGLMGAGGVCEGQNVDFDSSDGLPDLTGLCANGCSDAMADVFRQMIDAGCMDDESCDLDELEHEGVCVKDCSSDSSVCDDEGSSSNPYTCQSGKCLPADGSAPEADNPETIPVMLDFMCVTHPDGNYCYDKMEFLFAGNISGTCDQFEGLGCCYGWAKKLTGCFDENEWTQSTDANDPYLTNCPNAGLSTTPCSGTPSTCGASGLTMSLLVSFVSFLLYALNQ